MACDISKESDVKNMFDVINKDWGGLDICVNNAGMAYDDTILDGNPERWRTIYNVSNRIQSILSHNHLDCIEVSFYL